MSARISTLQTGPPVFAGVVLAIAFAMTLLWSTFVAEPGTSASLWTWLCLTVCAAQLGFGLAPIRRATGLGPQMSLVLLWATWLGWAVSVARVDGAPQLPLMVLVLVMTVSGLMLTVISCARWPVWLLALGAGVTVAWGSVVQMSGTGFSAGTMAPVMILVILAACAWRWSVAERPAMDDDALDAAAERLEQLEQELADVRASAQQSSDAKTALLANASHELRTPLNNIVGTTELMMSSATEEPFATGLRSVYESSRSLVNLLNDLLNLARADSTSWSAQVETCAPRKLTSQLVSSFSAQCAGKGITIEGVVDDSVPDWVKVDVLRLTQVINNLIANALKFTEQGGIRLAVRRMAESQLEIQVRDTGPGIPADFHDRLFEPFEQAREGRRASGVGLGLAITKRIVDSMGGRIYFESTEGVGTTFFVHFPVAAAVVSDRSANTTTGQVLAAQQPKSHYRVLYVDDNPENLQLASLQLKHLGYPHDTVLSARDAWDALRRRQYDLILLDCQMPEMDGYELAQKIRRESPNNHLTPIIAVTANVMGSERYRCLAAGMDDYLSKPVQIAQLAEAMDRWLRSSQPAADSGPVSSSVSNDLRQVSLTSGRSTVHELLDRLQSEMEDAVESERSEQIRFLATRFGLPGVADAVDDADADQQSILDAARDAIEDVRRRLG